MTCPILCSDGMTMGMTPGPPSTHRDRGACWPLTLGGILVFAVLAAVVFFAIAVVAGVGGGAVAGLSEIGSVRRRSLGPDHGVAHACIFLPRYFLFTLSSSVPHIRTHTHHTLKSQKREEYSCITA